MKNTLVGIIAFLIMGTMTGQDITGDWNGLLEIPGSPLRLIVHIEKTDDGYKATLDSPDQGAFGLAVNATSFEEGTLSLNATDLGIQYSGQWKEDGFKGIFTQGGGSLPLNLSREAIEKIKRNRPQEPKVPYPYYSEEVSFTNASANVVLAGTLSLPKKEGTFPVVILISGSGPQDRNEELLGHKPFLVLSDYLTRKGIGVLRYDDRGVAASTGDFGAATSADFASDVQSAIKYLKTRSDIDVSKIGLAGHSEGGLIAPMVAAENDEVAFIALLAGPGIRGDEILKKQGALIERASGKPENEIERTSEIRKRIFDMVMQSKDSEVLKNDITSFLQEVLKHKPEEVVVPGMSVEKFIDSQVSQVVSPWMLYFIKYDPVVSLEKVSCPVLAVNGEMDLQVPSKENLSAIENALKKGGNTNVTIVEFPGLNHLFQETETGAPSEYATIEETFSPVALETITSWILDQTK